MPQRIRVLVVDDSVVVRRLITDVLAGDPDLEVVGTAGNGQIALEKLAQLKPDVITLDIEMPVMDGLQTVREIRRVDRRVPVIMFSTLTERGASATLEALSTGANDYVTKPANVGSVAESMESVRSQLVPKIKALVPRFAEARPAFRPLPAPAAPAGAPAAPRARPAGGTGRPRALIIGSSTGGPEALTAVIPRLPANLPVPVLITQHMPPVFTKLYAQRLDKVSALTVVEAVDGQPVVPGTVYIAPGDFHMEVVRSGAGAVVRLQQGPPENFCRPAVDVMFRSALALYGGDLLAVVLTGMGSDGRIGCKGVTAAGGQVVVQDEATSVVWGMPGAVAREGVADEILPLPAIADAIVRRLGVPGAPVRAAAPAVPRATAPTAPVAAPRAAAPLTTAPRTTAPLTTAPRTTAPTPPPPAAPAPRFTTGRR
ncbi:chemotaxis response regulator protein-glutamate methylesterase [Kineococcus sp. NUM-3379]